MQPDGEHGIEGEVRPSISKDARLESKINDEKDRELAVATTEETSTES